MPQVLHGGWREDPPSDRDYDMDHPAVVELAERLALRGTPRRLLPRKVDLRDGFGPVRDQGNLNACTAFAVVSLFEHGMHRAGKRLIQGSPMFVYKVQRDLMQERGDGGSYLRTSMKALALAGVCPEKYWPYDPALLDAEPPAFCYAVADNYEAMVYYRLDRAEQPGAERLHDLKVHLARGLPVMFGSALYSSLMAAGDHGMLSEPEPGEPILLKHALVAAGYDDEKVLHDAEGTVRTGRGAVLVRSSWGPDWGEGGHAWLPYSYVLKGMVRDMWVLASTGMVDLQPFDPQADESDA